MNVGYIAYKAVFRFDHHSNLITWEESKERQSWLVQLQPLLEKKLQYEKHEGMEFWFDLPDIPPKTIPRYKMAIVTLLAVYPLILTLYTLLPLVLPAGIPKFITILISCVCTCLLMTWFVMPFMTRIFSSWLFKDA